MEVKGDIELTKRSLEDLKKDIIKAKTEAFAKIINSRAWSYVKVQPMVYNKERKQEMKNILRMVELMKTYPRQNDGSYEIPGRYIDDILKRLKNVESTL